MGEKTAVAFAEREDQAEDKIRSLSENLKNEETRAEFGERTVEKLETNIDILQDALFNEKAGFIELSKKLDQTLNDMMSFNKLFFVKLFEKFHAFIQKFQRSFF